ncbi:hypothetical protein HII36_52475 [Nonomuraea sp. NN258]|uniref:hypothetical protein n=1 Tax=Nonomuraea antri TaxID=2730852 RepID=UPI001568F2E9|nr:hypothetical protein [Nonomuraea antri]NRQ40381.1 hypothetical protein [Nonomuraea antri]
MTRRLAVLLVLFLIPGCGSDAAMSRAAIDRARSQGVAPELIYVVDLPGYQLAEQSVGGSGDDGFGAVYVGGDGRQVELRVERGTYECAETCESDEHGGWYGVHQGRQQYGAVHGDHYVLLSAPVGQIDRSTLKAAAVGARAATG